MGRTLLSAAFEVDLVRIRLLGSEFQPIPNPKVKFKSGGKVKAQPSTYFLLTATHSYFGLALRPAHLGQRAVNTTKENMIIATEIAW